MKNAIVINGHIYELVPDTARGNVCETCDLYVECHNQFTPRFCELFHNAKPNEHYVRQPKEEKK